MNGGLVRVQQLHHAVGLRVHRPALGQVGHRLGGVQEACDPARRRGIDDYRVVNRKLVLVDAHHRLFDLAGEQHVAQAGRDRRRELDRADAAHRPAGDAEVVEHVEVFQKRGLDVDRQRVDLAAPLGGRDLDLFVGQRRNVEELRNPLAPFDFDEKDFAAPRRQGQCQRGRDRRLAGAAFAGHEMQAGLRQARRPADGTTAARCLCHHRMLARVLRSFAKRLEYFRRWASAPDKLPS